MDPDFVVEVKCTIFWLNKGLRLYFDLFAPDFPKSTSKYLFCTEVFTKHGFRCFTVMCNFRRQCFLEELFWAAKSFILFQTYVVNVILTFFNNNKFKWLEWFLKQECLPNRVFCTHKKKYWGQNGTLKYFLKNPAHTNPNISSNLCCAKL